MLRRSYRIASFVTLGLAAIFYAAFAGFAQKGEGIEVHGHWKIEILNPDGSHVSTTDFHNDLVQPYGSQHLVRLLARVQSQGRWTVDLGGGNSPVCTDGFCNISESASAGVESSDLTVTAALSSFVLAGSVVAQQDGTLVLYNARPGVCAGSVSPESCTASTGPAFSSAGVAGVVVVAGQIIQVTVTYTFS